MIVYPFPFSREVQDVLFEPGHSQFDLNFSLFGIHVRVHPGFWLMSAILGFVSLREGVEFLLVWIVCVFVSILVHEMGHVLVGKIFGSHGHIVLYSFGGLAIGSNDVRHRWQRIAVLLGGPGAGFILGGIVVALAWSHAIPPFANDRVNDLVDDAIWNLMWVNIGWGLVNLLPVFPLDGGQISKELWEWGTPQRGFVYCLRLSIVVAGLIAAHSLLSYLSHNRGAHFHYPLDFIPSLGLFGTLLFASLAGGAYQLLATQRQVDQHWDDKWDDWRDDRDSWKR